MRPEKDADNRTRHSRNDNQHRVAKDVAIENLPLRQTFRPRRRDVQKVHLIQKRVLDQQGGRGKTPDRHGDQGQRHVPEVIADLSGQLRLPPIVRDKAPQGKPMEVTAAGEDHDEKHGEKKRRDGVAAEIMAVVEMSKLDPSRRALAMPRGIETR